VLASAGALCSNQKSTPLSDYCIQCESSYWLYLYCDKATLSQLENHIDWSWKSGGNEADYCSTTAEWPGPLVSRQIGRD